MSFASSASGAPGDPPLGPIVGDEGGAPVAAAPMAAPAPVDDLGAAALAQSRADLRLFAGRNADAFFPATDGPTRSSRKDRCWPGFFFPSAWFLYRKMYGYAALTVLLPVVSSLMHFPVEATRSIGLGLGILGVFGKTLYRLKARRMVAEIRAAAPDEASAREAIARAGGVSPAGAVLGALVLAAFLVFAYLKA